MADIKTIKKLREATGAGISDCQDALKESKGDMEKAKQIIKKKGVAKAAKRSEREVSEGLVGVYLHPATNKLAAVVEVCCETDFVARNEKFKKFVDDVALQVAGMSPEFVSKEDITKKQIKKWEDQIKEERDNPSKQELEGRIQSMIREKCLLEQPYLKDEDKTIGEMLTDLIAVIGENIKITRFVRFQMGEPVVVAEYKKFTA